MLDVVLTRGDLPALSTNVSQPDHSTIVCQLNISAQDHHDTVVQYRRNWRSFDLDAFRADIASSQLVQSSTPDNVDELFTVYRSTLATLVDKHAPVRRLMITTRRSIPWFDGECRAAKRLTRKLERIYRRRCYSTTARTEWLQQFQKQR